MGLDQLLASKIHNNLNSRKKIMKKWQCPSFLSFNKAEKIDIVSYYSRTCAELLKWSTMGGPTTTLSIIPESGD